MSELIFRKLFVQSTTQNLAGMFRFENGLNLIVAVDNSVGKSTLIRLPLWTFGCEFPFDAKWKVHDVKSVLQFEIDGVTYFVARYRNKIRLRKGNEIWVSYHSESDEYEAEFARLMRFHALLPRRNEPWIHEVPPPAYYFSAFYVDQRRGWTSPWNSFEIYKYDGWRSPILNYHTGYLSGEYFAEGAAIAKDAQEMQDDENLIEQYGRAVEVLTLLAPKQELPETDAELDSAIQEIQESMVAVKRREQRALSVLRGKQEELEVTKVQRGIAMAAVTELEKDYDFAATQLRDDVLVCPLCGTTHDNTLLERATLLQDREQAEKQVNELTFAQGKIEAAIDTTLKRLQVVRDDLSKLNRKYRRLDKDVTVKTILETMGTDSVRRRADEESRGARLRLQKNRPLLRKRRLAQRELIDIELSESIDAYYRKELAELCSQLRLDPAFNIESALPRGYRELAVDGGGADSSRMQLAYHLSIYQVVKHFDTEVLAPLMLDTPNQQDQGALNYGLISEELTRRAKKDMQMFVCATRHDAMKSLEEGAHVIQLASDKLLTEEPYERISAAFERVFNT